MEGAQEIGGGAVQRGDRCVAELTTLLQRIVERSWLRLRSAATAEQQRYTASFTDVDSSLKVTGECLSFEPHLESSRLQLVYTVQSFLHLVDLDWESDA